MSATPAATGVLVTGAASPLGQAVAAALGDAGYAVTAAGDDLTDPAAVAPLLDGAGAIVHLAPLSLPQTMAAAAPAEVLDAAARGTHVLLKAAAERGGPGRVVLGSTLAVLDAYPDDLEVTEAWRPRPRPDPAEMAPYLAELTAREFTRDVQLDDPPRIVCLRFGRLSAAERAGDDRALPLADAAQAVRRALAALESGRRGGHRWQLYHIAALDPGARYSSAGAQQALGYGAPDGAEGGERR
ncbi:MAG TPA: NAD(P)-dependent oxidoreductase [Chloroflexota bacterium]|nr:NAD(P)-dependent oxidoreductase [Chloroflexota bacterium]